MLATKLVRMIETHFDKLSLELAAEIRTSDRTSDFRKIRPEDLQLSATEVYGNLEDWLLHKTDADIARRFTMVGARRAAQGIRLHQCAWALMLTRDHLWNFLRREAFADTLIQLYGEMELLQLLNQFFDRALYYAIEGYEEATRLHEQKTDLQRARDFATSIGLMSPAPDASSSVEG